MGDIETEKPDKYFMELFSVDEGKMDVIKTEIPGDAPSTSGNSRQFIAEGSKEERNNDGNMPDIGSSDSVPGDMAGNSGSYGVEGWHSIVKVESSVADGVLDDVATNSTSLQGWMADSGGADEAGPSGNTETKPVTSEVSEAAATPEVSNLVTSEDSQHGEVMEDAVDKNDQKPFVCDHCGYRCRKACRLRVHMMKHSGERPFACKICDYRSSRPDILKQHMLSHLSQMPYACEVCDYKTNTASKLKRHVNTHFDEMSYSCDFCDYKCSFTELLKKHVRTHTGEKPFKCDICDYRCAQAGHLKRHKLTHSGDKQLVCHLCDYRTTQADNLKIHMRKHTGEKPYFCDYCDYRCNISSQMTKHTRTHTGETPYACDLCNFKCKQQDNLRVHMRKHTGERPFTCEFCNMKFSTNGVLKRHLQRKHLKDNDPKDIPKVEIPNASPPMEGIVAQHFLLN